MNNTTFAEQAETYMLGLAKGRRQRSDSTLSGYQSYLDAQLLPRIGSKRLRDINEAVLKPVFDEICPKLSPSTITCIRNVFKGVMDSAVDETGRKLYARDWNWGFLDLPEVVPAEQDAPAVARETLQEAICGGDKQDRLLWGLIAASGLRAGEAFAVTTVPGAPGNYWNPADRTITVTCQRTPEGKLTDPKTASGVRTVDLCSQMNDFLVRHASEGPVLFPLSYGGYLKRFKKAFPATGRDGFHSIRRFRLTQIQASGVPETLDRFWSGHAATDVHTRYAVWDSKLIERREWAEKIGLGFELPA